jgi:endonuclease/exonuclease/phosphatase (EEP) superfamily protein YafD
VLALIGVGVASSAGLLAPLGWPFELFVHFRLQYGVAAGLLAPALLALRRPVGAVVAILLAMAQLWPSRADLQASSSAPRCSGEAFSVVTANLGYDNTDVGAFIDWLSRSPVDLVLLQEVTPAWKDALDALPGYPHRRLIARTDAYGLGVLSTGPAGQLAAQDLAGDGLPALVGPVDAGGGRFELAALHARWPLLPELMRYRDRALSTLAAEVRRQPGTWLVGGDLNMTSHSPVFRRLLDESGLREALPDGDWAPSWLAGFWPLALRIDHILVTPDLCFEAGEIGPDIGSDHRPVRVRLRWPGRTGDQSAASISPLGAVKARQHSPSQARKRTTFGSAKVSGGAARNHALR